MYYQTIDYRTIELEKLLDYRLLDKGIQQIDYR